MSAGESPDRLALIDGIETGVELTLIKAGSADHIIAELFRLASQKHKSYGRRAIFDTRPIILLGHLDWPAKNVDGPALYEAHEELEELIVPSDFDGFGFSEIWLMDAGFEAQVRGLQSNGAKKIFREQISSVASRSQLEAAIDSRR